jgi:hypothetical protein
MVNELACPHCDGTIYNQNKDEGLYEEKAYGVRALPAAAINGKSLECYRRGPITKEYFKAAGFGQPL